MPWFGECLILNTLSVAYFADNLLLPESSLFWPLFRCFRMSISKPVGILVTSCKITCSWDRSHRAVLLKLAYLCDMRNCNYFCSYFLVQVRFKMKNVHLNMTILKVKKNPKLSSNMHRINNKAMMPWFDPIINDTTFCLSGKPFCWLGQHW